MAGLLAAVDAQNGLDIGGHRLIMTPGQVAVAQSEVGDIGFRQTLETEQSVAGKHGLDELVDLTILPRPRFLLSERFLAQSIVAFDKPVVLLDQQIVIRHQLLVHRPEIGDDLPQILRSEEHTSELQSLMRISYAVFCLKKKTNHVTDKHNR